MELTFKDMLNPQSEAHDWCTMQDTAPPRRADCKPFPCSDFLKLKRLDSEDNLHRANLIFFTKTRRDTDN